MGQFYRAGVIIGIASLWKGMPPTLLPTSPPPHLTSCLRASIETVFVCNPTVPVHHTQHGAILGTTDQLPDRSLQGQCYPAFFKHPASLVSVLCGPSSLSTNYPRGYIHPPHDCCMQGVLEQTEAVVSNQLVFFTLIAGWRC